MRVLATYERWYAETLRGKLERPYVHMLFGARQTGKSTLLREVLPTPSLAFDLADPRERFRLLADIGSFEDACRALPSRRAPHVVFVDEAQAVPAVFDAVQHLFDTDRHRWRFVLCGSSARKLRTTGANLLPGRSFLHRLFPLVLAEHPPRHGGGETAALPMLQSPLPFDWPRPQGERRTFPAWDLEQRLAYGSLPGIVAGEERDRADLLAAYAAVHLEEEILREAAVRNWAAFLQFLALAAAESGSPVNFARIAGRAGVSLPTVKNYYQLLEDMFVGFRVPAWSQSRRKNLLSTPKFLFFDLGVRHAAAGFIPSVHTVRSDPGPIFEQWVGIELWKRVQYSEGTLFHLRSEDGMEIDYIVQRGRDVVPIEVKWTDRPSRSDARHLLRFLDEHPATARHAWIICRCPRPLRLDDRVTALPWSAL